MKYSFLMPYYKRAGQLHNALVSFNHHYSDRNDYEVLVVEDVKNTKNIDDHTKLLGTIALNDNIKITHIIAGSLNQWNPAPLFNKAATEASGEYLIITNPECFHKTNILNGLDDEFSKNPDVYVVCACESFRNCNHFIDCYDNFKGDHHRWFQHSQKRNAQYHFCSALSRNNWNKIGGFDKGFAKGIGYDDNDFRDAVKHAGIPFVTRDDLLTIHIQHEKSDRPSDYKHLLKKNEELYKRKSKERAL